VDPASVFLVQKVTGAILASGRRQSPNLANLALVYHYCSRARQQIIKRKLDRIAVSKVFGDPPDIGREQKAGNELAIDFTSSTIAHRSLKTELSLSIRHVGFSSDWILIAFPFAKNKVMLSRRHGAEAASAFHRRCRSPKPHQPFNSYS